MTYQHHGTFTYSSFLHSIHQQEGDRLLLFPTVCLRIVVNSNTPLPPYVPAANPSLLLHILTSHLLTVYKPQYTALLQAFTIGNETMSKL